MGGGEIFMSGKGVDERILSMKFDNASFEKNAKVTINTLDKLQRTLDTTKLSKDISNLYSYVTKIGTEVKTFIAIKYAIKGIDAALKSVTEGGKRRAENLENAHFQLQGLLKDEEKVSEIMNDVSKSVDGTAYGLDAAAKVASQLAASNVKAGDQMFTALRGIAGVAAMTNSSYEDIGRIFTQVAGQGRLMGDQLLQLSGRGMNAAATLAEEFGLTEAAVRDMVSKGQISFDMFSQAMDSAFGEHAKKANETMTGALSNVKSALGRIGALFYSPLIEQNGALVQLFNALRVKTNELKDTLAPTISKIVDIAIKAINWATSIINKIDFSSIASKILKPFTTVKQTFDDIGTKVQSTSKIITNASDVINEVINGKWDVGAKRWDKLTNAGYNWVAVQNGVNETLGSTYRHAEQLSNTIDDLTNNVSDSNQVINLSNNTLALTKRNYAATKTSVSGLSDAMSQLSIYANKAGYSVDDVIKDHSLLSMSSLLLDSLSNIVKIIKSLGKSIAKSWNNVFGSLDNVNPVFNLIAGFRKLTSELQITEEVSDKITRTFNGLFAVLDLIRMVVGGGVSLAMKAIRFIFETFGIKILDVTAALGDAIVAVRNWIKNTLKSSGILNGIKRILTPIIKLIVDAAKSIYNWAKENDLLNKIASGLGTILQGVAYFIEKVVTKVVDWIKNSSVLRSILTKVGSVISELIDKTSKWIDGLKNTDSIPEYIISGLVSGLTSGIVKVKEVVGLLANTILSTLREILGIHSPARVPMEYGELTGEGYAIGLSHANEKGVKAATEFTGKVLTTMKDITVEGARNLVSNMPKIMDVISKIPWGSIVFGGMAIALVKGVGKLNTTIDKVGAIVANNPLTILTKAVENYTAGMKNLLTELGKAKKIKAITQMMYSVAVSIGVLAASIYLLSKVDKGGMVRAMIMITFIAAILAALTSLMYFLDKKSSAWNKVDKDAKLINSTVLNLIGIAASFLLMAAAFKTLASIKQENVAQAIVMMGALWLIALTLMPLSVISNKVNGAGKTMLYIAVSFLIMAKVMKYVGKLDSDTIFKGLATLNAFKWMVIQMMAINGLCKSMNNAGKNMMYISVAFLVMAKVVKYAGSISEKETNRGINTLKKFTGLVITLMVVQGVIDFLNSNSAGSKRAYSNVGKMILYIAIAFGVMTLVIKAISKISDKNLKRGIGVLWIFAGLVSALIAVGHFLGDVKGSALSIGASILLVTISMLGMAIVAGIIGFIPIRMLKKGVTVVSIFGLIIMGLMKCASYVKPDAKKALGSVLSLMITMAAIVVIFSLIDTKKLYESVGAVAILSALIAGLMIATGYVKPNDDALKGLKKVMIILVVVAAIIVVMDQFGVNGENALKNAIAIGIILVALASSLFILSKIEKVSKNAIDSLYKITPVLGLIGIVLFLLDAFDVQSNITNAISLGILINALAAAVVILSYSKDVSNDAYKAAIVLGMVMVLLGYALSLINNSDPISSLANALAMSIVLGAITASLLLLSHMKDIKKTVFSTLALMIVAILAIGSMLALVSKQNPLRALASAIAMSIVLIVVISAIEEIATIKAKKIDKKILGVILFMSVLIVAIGKAFSYMFGLNAVEMVAAAIAFKLVLGQVVNLFYYINNAARDAQIVRDKGGLIKVLMYLGAIVVALVLAMKAIVYALQGLQGTDPVKLIASAIALSMVIGTVGGIAALIFKILNDIDTKYGGGGVKSALGPMIFIVSLFTMLSVTMFAIAGALALMDNMKNTVENAKALSSVLLSLTPIVLVLGIISALLQGDVAMLGSKSVLLILAGMIVTMAAIVGALALMQNIKNAQANAMLLALMLNVMADVLLKIALVAPLALIGAAAMAVLSLVLVELGVLIGVIGGLVTAIPELETFLNKGAPIMVMLAKTLGQMISAFIVGIAEGLMEILPALGKSLSDFANNLLMGFIPVMMIATDESIVKGAGNITAAILAITVAELVQAVATIVTGGAGMINLAIQLSQFAIGIQPFIIACKQVTPEVASGAAAISNAVLTITKAELIAGLLSFMEALTGTNSMTKLTSDLQQFGEAMVIFSDTISGKIDTEAVKAATAAGSMMSTFYENMPREGGLIPGIQKLIGGEPDMEGFSKSMAAFGLALVEVNNALLNENGECVINLNAIKAAADAGKIMVELQNSLPKTGGWVQAVLGETDMGEFGLSVAKYGESIVKFNDTVTDPNTGKSKLNKEAIQAAADAGKIMAELNEKVPTSNGFWQDVAGSKDLGEFGLSIEAYGQAMIRFSDAVVDENGTVKINPRAVDAAYYAGNIFASLTNSLAPQQGVISSLFTSEKDLSDFGAQLESFGTSVVNFSSTVDGNLGDDPKGMVDDVSYIVTSILGVLPSEENGNKAILDKNLIGKFGDNFKTLGEKIKAFSDKVKNIDETAVTSAAQAIKDLSAAGASMESVTTTGANSFGAKLTALADAMYDFNTKMTNYDFSGLKTFAEALVDFAHISIDNYVLAYKDGYKQLYSAGYSAGETTRRGFSDALLDPIEKPIATIMTTVMETIANTLNDDNKKESIRIGAGNVVSLIIAEFNYRLGIGPTATNDFYNIGVKIIASIIDGMSDKAASARDRAGIIRDDIYSIFDKKPSPRAGTKANGNALSGLQSAAEDVANAISLSTEFQPTIRPILDLSDITSGGKRINSIFDGFSISTSFRLAATSNSMFNANRSNTISPLDILKNISGTPKTVNNYEINGISYDDGSTIANAVLQLINAVRVEERM
jgi:tape measure domain-containing protein